MIKSIDYLYKNKKIASFYCNQDDTRMHLTGFIEKFNESEILIAHISAHGYYDGYILKRIEDVYRIDYDGAYENKIEKLYSLRKQLYHPIDTFDPDEEEILYSLLDYTKNNDLIMTLEFKDSLLSGLVNGYDDNIVYLSIIDDMGFEKGISIIDIDKASTISVDTDDEQDLNILRKCNTGEN